MGARPLTAMNLVAWPSDLDFGVLGEVLRGGMEKVLEAGAELGRRALHRRQGAQVRPGRHRRRQARRDRLQRRGRGGRQARAHQAPRHRRARQRSQERHHQRSGHDAGHRGGRRAQRGGGPAMALVGVHACTDVSGFGLAGHLGEMLDASGAAGAIHLAALPLHDGVLDLIARSVYAGGLRNNREYLLPRLHEVGPAGAADMRRRPGRRPVRRSRRRAGSRRPRALRPADVRRPAPGRRAREARAAARRPRARRRRRLDGRRGRRRSDRSARARGLTPRARSGRTRHHPFGRGRPRRPRLARPGRRGARRRPRGPSVDIVVRALSVVPFLLVAALRAHRHRQLGPHHRAGHRRRRSHLGRGAGPLRLGQLLWELLLAVLIGLAPLLVTLAASWATVARLR